LYKRFAQNLAQFLLSKNLAEHWDLPNTGIFYSKNVASVQNQFDGSFFIPKQLPDIMKQLSTDIMQQPLTGSWRYYI
jgi:hypothetical protein